MNTALKFDEEKIQLDLLPIVPLYGVARVLMFGAKKYTKNNWRKGLAWGRCYAAALRHLFAWWSGETNDPETGLNHLDHALCEIMFLREFTETHTELDDRPKQVEEKEPSNA
ncbi:dATP/dGTP diphosphohydrolase domain-containing protein [Cloacibacillus porcorum]|uniref:dATP/dGTP diphosphohydrolase domain-containing protein n=1 Tax=Cloacibacillus porcorum TaxID=1197717 RepID=UPI00197E4E92|nr:dATP/dGTP diphosphohydrolase domain-containing protein [Cloacibacillus porcorum]